MIPDREAVDRFEAISQAKATIADLELQIKTLIAERDLQRTRADQAEARERMLYAQLVNPARETKSVYTPMTMKADREKHDAEVGKLLSAGWVFMCDGNFQYGQIVERYTTLTRVAPIAAEPIQPAATMAATPSTVKESLTVADPAPETPLSVHGEGQGEGSLPITRKTVAATAILEPGDMPAIVDPASIEVDPPMTRDEEIKATAEKAYNDALARNPLPVYKPLPSYKPNNSRSAAP